MSNQLDYKKYDYDYPTYIREAKSQEVGGQAVTLNSNGGQNSKFHWPIVSFGPDKCTLSYDIEFAEVNGAYLWIYANCHNHFRNLRYYAKNSSNAIAEIENPGIYSAGVLLPETKFEEYKNFDKYSNSIDGTYHGSSKFLRPCNSLTSDNLRCVASTGTAANYHSSVNYDEPLYMYIGPLGDGADAGIVKFHVEVELGDLMKNTFFSIDKPWMFPDVTYFQMIWESVSQMAFTSTSNTSIAGVAAYTGAVAISNLQLFVARQTNDSIEKKLWHQIENGGLKMKIPYVLADNRPLATGTQRTILMRYDRNNGSKLLKTYVLILPQTHTIQNSYNLCNYNGLKVSQYHVRLDDERFTENDLICTSGEDYHELKDELKGSCILDSNMFYYNWFIRQSFVQRKDLLCDYCPGIPDENKDQGLDLSVDRHLSFVMRFTTSGTEYDAYIYSIVERELVVGLNSVNIY